MEIGLGKCFERLDMVAEHGAKLFRPNRTSSEAKMLGKMLPSWLRAK